MSGSRLLKHLLSSLLLLPTLTFAQPTTGPGAAMSIDDANGPTVGGPCDAADVMTAWIVRDTGEIITCFEDPPATFEWTVINSNSSITGDLTLNNLHLNGWLEVDGTTTLESTLTLNADAVFDGNIEMDPLGDPTCIEHDTDTFRGEERLFGDLDCDGVKEEGEQWLDDTGIGARPPTEFLNLEAWYDASTIEGVAHLGDVTAWADLTGNGHDLSTETGSDDPWFYANEINGLPSVEFRTGDKLMIMDAAISLASSTGYAIFIVYRASQEPDQSTYKQAYFMGHCPTPPTACPTNNSPYHQRAHVFLDGDGGNQVATAVYPLASQDFALISIDFAPTAYNFVTLTRTDAGAHDARLNGLPTGGGGVNTEALTLSTVAEDSITGHIWIAELLVFDVEMDSDAILQIEAYLSQKYNIEQAPIWKRDTSGIVETYTPGDDLSIGGDLTVTGSVPAKGSTLELQYSNAGVLAGTSDFGSTYSTFTYDKANERIVMNRSSNLYLGFNSVIFPYDTPLLSFVNEDVPATNPGNQIDMYPYFGGQTEKAFCTITFDVANTCSGDCTVRFNDTSGQTYFTNVDLAEGTDWSAGGDYTATAAALAAAINADGDLTGYMHAFVSAPGTLIVRQGPAPGEGNPGQRIAADFYTIDLVDTGSQITVSDVDGGNLWGGQPAMMTLQFDTTYAQDGGNPDGMHLELEDGIGLTFKPGVKDGEKNHPFGLRFEATPLPDLATNRVTMLDSTGRYSKMTYEDQFNPTDYGLSGDIVGTDCDASFAECLYGVQRWDVIPDATTGQAGLYIGSEPQAGWIVIDVAVGNTPVAGQKITFDDTDTGSEDFIDVDLVVGTHFQIGGDDEETADNIRDAIMAHSTLSQFMVATTGAFSSGYNAEVLVTDRVHGADSRTWTTVEDCDDISISHTNASDLWLGGRARTPFYWEKTGASTHTEIGDWGDPDSTITMATTVIAGTGLEGYDTTFYANTHLDPDPYVKWKSAAGGWVYSDDGAVEFDMIDAGTAVTWTNDHVFGTKYTESGGDISLWAVEPLVVQQLDPTVNATDTWNFISYTGNADGGDQYGFLVTMMGLPEKAFGVEEGASNNKAMEIDGDGTMYLSKGNAVDYVWTNDLEEVATLGDIQTFTAIQTFQDDATANDTLYLGDGTSTGDKILVFDETAQQAYIWYETTSNDLEIETTHGDVMIDDDLEVTGTANVDGVATGAMGAFDLTVGDTTTPDYGAIQIGQTGIYSSSFSTGNIDLGGTMVFRQEASVSGILEFAWMEGGNTIRAGIPESGAGNAANWIRSFMVAGPYSAATGDNHFICDTHTAYNGNIDCDTGSTGADLFVQDDLEVEGTIFAHETINLEGATADGNQVIVQVGADPGADVTLTLPIETSELAKLDVGQTFEGVHEFDADADGDPEGRFGYLDYLGWMEKCTLSPHSAAGGLGNNGYMIEIGLPQAMYVDTFQISITTSPSADGDDCAVAIYGDTNSSGVASKLASHENWDWSAAGTGIVDLTFDSGATYFAPGVYYWSISCVAHTGGAFTRCVGAQKNPVAGPSFADKGNPDATKDIDALTWAPLNLYWFAMFHSGDHK
jgi:hypothetical protein